MRATRELFLISLAAMAILVTAAPAIADDGPVEVVDETGATPQHCTAVTKANHQVSGGCYLELQTLVGLSGGFRFIGHHPVFGEINGDLCDNIMEMRVDENGHGYIYNVQFFGEDEDCEIYVPCSEPGGETPWEVQLFSANNSVYAHIDFCLVTFFGNLSGEFRPQINTKHSMRSILEPIIGTTVEVLTQWEIVNENAVHYNF